MRAAVAVLVGLAGCGGEEPIQVLVDVQTDLVPGVELDCDDADATVGFRAERACASDYNVGSIGLGSAMRAPAPVAVCL